MSHPAVVAQSLSCVWFFAAPWTAARQAPLSSTVSWSLLKFMSFESVMPSNHLICCRPLPLPPIFPNIRVFSGGQSIGASASASVLPVNSQGWFPLQSTGLIFLQSKGSQESSPAPEFESISSSALSLLYGPTLTSVCDYWKNHNFDHMDLC